MFEVGFTELLLIFAIALIVLGPEKLPKLAQQVGHERPLGQVLALRLLAHGPVRGVGSVVRSSSPCEVASGGGSGCAWPRFDECMWWSGG